MKSLSQNTGALHSVLCPLKLLHVVYVLLSLWSLCTVDIAAERQIKSYFYDQDIFGKLNKDTVKDSSFCCEICCGDIKISDEKVRSNCVMDDVLN